MAHISAEKMSPDMVRPNMLKRQNIPLSIRNVPDDSSSSRRIVILGKTGVGKSASGNTILGVNRFRSEMSARECSEAHTTVSGRSVSVVDTPGLFHSKMKSEDLEEEIARSVYISNPGPHAFLIVFPVNMRFTDQEQQIPQIIEMMFGQEVLNYSIILFTHGDHLYGVSVEELIKENNILSHLVDQCGGRFHVFNNKDQNNREQVNDLLQKIDTMIEQNGGGHYSNQMNEDAQRFREVEEMRQREEEEKMKMEETMVTTNPFLNLILLGRTGVGKSSSGNTILGREAFISKRSSRSGNGDVTAEVGDVCGLPVTVHDTPGSSGTDSKEEFRKYEEVLQKCESGLCVFLLVIKADRLTEEERETVEKIEELLGEKRLEKTWILFTRGDELEEKNKTINEVINETEPLKKLVQKYDQRYHVFNNKIKVWNEQVNSLITKVFQNNLKNLSKIPQQRAPINIQDTPADSPSSRRIVFLGKSGVGKSGAGNTILGQREFNSVMSMNSVTRECSDARATISGRSVSVVDAPGFFDMHMNTEELIMEIERSVYLSSPGPHAFLIVFPVNMWFTEQEQQIPQMIEMMFGQEVLKYSIILFTHGDHLEEQTVEKIIEWNSDLRDLVQQCGGRYHVFNNEDLNNREQVNDLLQKIDTMIEQNGGGHYSNQMNEDAQIFRLEEEEQRQIEEEERKQQEKIGRMIKKIGAEFEAQKRLEILRRKAKIQSEEEGAIVNFIHFCPGIKSTLYGSHCQA